MGHNTIRHYVEEQSIKVNACPNTTIITLPTLRSDPSLDTYLSLYPIEKKRKKLVFFKSVHKKEDGRYIAGHDNNFEYFVGKVTKQEIIKNIEDTCGPGLHIAHKSWALEFGGSRSDQALLECEVDPKDIFVSKDCDGKVRTCKLKVIREVPKEERYI